MLKKCCSECCKTPYDLGCVSPCAGSSIVINYTATSDLNLEFHTEFSGSGICIETAVPTGGLITLPTDSLNENYQFSFVIYDKDTGVQLMFEDGRTNTTHDCFLLTTAPGCNVLKVQPAFALV